MMDIYTQEKRSNIMSLIKKSDTKPEIIIRSYLFSKGIRYRINDKKILGSPDIVIRKYNCLIFVNGCFWHGHKNCKASILPKSRKEFWKKKISGNIKRDSHVFTELKKQGWNVILIWECELKNKQAQMDRFSKLDTEILVKYKKK